MENPNQKKFYLYSKQVKQSPNGTKMYKFSVVAIQDLVSETLSIGISACSSKDIYKKAVGRNIAEERAEFSPFKVLTGNIVLDSMDISFYLRGLISDMEKRAKKYVTLIGQMEKLEVSEPLGEILPKEAMTLLS